MSDLRIRHNEGLRRRAAELFCSGLGSRPVARELGIAREAVRKWEATFRAVGLEGLLNMGKKQTVYDYGTRVAAARAVVDEGMAKPEAMERFGIASMAPLQRWCALYREGGAEALRPRPKGRPKGSAGPRTREQELEERVRKLEAQVAYLKKFRALASRDPR